MTDRSAAAEDLDRRVRILIEQEGPAAALEHLRTLIADPDIGPTATSRLAWLHERLGDSGEALSVLEAGRERFPADHELVVDHADVLARTNRGSDATALLQSLVDDNPTHGPSLAALAARVVDDDLDAGLELAERALDADPRTVRAHAVRIDAARATGDRERVLEAVEAAVRAVPDAPALRLLRASVRLDRGDTSGALDDLRAVWAMAPGHPGVHELTLEIVKRRQPLYRLLLAYQRGVRRLGRWALFAALIVLISVRTGLEFIATAADGAGLTWVGPLAMVLFVFAVLLTWVADPITDLIVDLDDAGRMLISRSRRFRGQVIGVLVLGGMIFGPVGAIADHPTMLSWGLLLLMATIPANVALSVDGWSQRVAQLVLLLVTAIGTGSVVAYATGDVDDASGLALTGALLCALSTWLLAAASWMRRS